MMKKRFKARKKIKIQIIIIIILFISVFLVTLKYLCKNILTYFNQENYIAYIYNESINYSGSQNKKFFDYFNNPNFIIKYALNIKNINMDEEVTNLGEYINDPNPQVIKEPLIYIYNTHQTESYQFNKINEYNLAPTVLLTSYILREKLNDLNLPTLVETSNITEILKTNNWAYKYSYQASRLLISDALEKYPSIKLIIDLHRDSSSYEKTTTNIENINYAKVLFVVGGEYDNYENNLNVAKKINNIIISKYPNLSRGVLLKKGAGVNGIYNQDLFNEAILLEMGGQYNTIEEVNNTVNIIASCIYDYLNERTS